MIIKKDEILIADNIKIADTFMTRLVGLLGRKSIAENEGILFTKSSQIHTFFMRFNIDIIFLDKNRKILKICHDLKPFRITSHISESYSGFVSELKSGTAKKFDLKIGDFIGIIN